MKNKKENMPEKIKKAFEEEIGFHFNIIKKCTISIEEGKKKVVLATLPGSRYPYFYPRDTSCASHLLNTLSKSGFSYADEAYELLKGITYVALSVQREDG